MADRSVKVVLGANVTGLVQGMNQAKRATQDFATGSAKYYKENQQQLDQIGSSAFKVGAGLTAVAAFAVKSAMDWEVAWTGVLKTVEGTPAELSKIEDGLRGLSKETGFASTEVAAVGEAAGQLGISTGGITAFTETVLAMGVSTSLSTDEAATGLARFANIMGSSEGDIDNMGSSIVALGNNFATTESEILEMSLRLAGAGRQAGLSESDVLGIAAAMSSVGIEAEAGGTALSLTLKRIGREVETGGDKLDLFAKTAGYAGPTAAADFAAAWGDDASGALTQFVAGLGKTEAMGMSTNAVLTELGITGIRESDALLRLSGSAEGLADALGTSSESWAQNIALMDEADKFYNTTSQKGKQAWAEIKDAAVDAGNALLPVVAAIAEGVGSIASAFGSLPGPVKGGVTAIAGVAGVSLLAISGLIKLAGAIEATRTAMNGLSGAGAGSSRAISGLVKTAVAITGVVAAAEVADRIGERGSDGIAKLSKNLEEFGQTGKAVGDLGDLFGKDLGGVSLRFAKDLGGIGEALNSFSGYADDGSVTKMIKDIGSATAAGGIYEQVEAIQDMDAAFAMLARNDPDKAIKSFERLRDAALADGSSVEKLSEAFPTMTELLRGASEQMGGTADSSEILNGSLTDLAPAAQASAEEMAAMQEAAMATAESFFDMGDSLEGSLDGFGDSLVKQTEALASFRQNAAEALRKGADETLVDYLIEQGPAGAQMLDQLANGSEDAVDRINEAWSGSREEIAAFVEYSTGVPKEIVTEFSAPGADDAVDTAVELAGKYEELDSATVATILEALDYSTPQIEEVLGRLRDLDGENANPSITLNAAGVSGQIGQIGFQLNNLPSLKIIEIRGVKTGADIGAMGGYTGMQIPQGFAGGGKVPGTAPSNPRVDNVMAVGANTGQPLKVRSGEWIINESASKQNDAWLAAVNSGLNLSDVFGNIQGFADGGRLDRLNAERRVRDLNRDLRERERYGRKPSKGRDTRKTRYVLRGLDRTIAREEREEARAEVRDLRKPRSQRKEAIAERAEKKADAKKQRSEDIAGESESYSGNADIQSFTSPASVNRALGQAINDMATYTQLLIQLKKKGAAPWLLQQLQKAGPSRGSISLARKYLSDTGALKAVNAQAAQLSAVSGIYGQVTTDARWDASKAWSGSLSSAQSKTLQKGSQVTVNQTVMPQPGMSEEQVAQMAGSKIMQAFR